LDGGEDQFNWISSVDANGLLIDGVEVYSSRGDQTTKRFALLTPNETGRWQVDFGAFARPMKHSWQDLLSGRVKESTVRVVVKDDHYFNGRFDNESHWQCFQLSSLGEEIPLYGYCPRDSPQSKALGEALSATESAGDKAGRRVTLKIVHPDGAEDSQFEIQSVLAEDWIISGTRFDERFH
jgi:hypothetical protein